MKGNKAVVRPVAQGILLLSLALSGCLPNRLPPEPREQERPQFVALLEPSAVYVEDPSDSALLLELRLTAGTGFPVPVDPTFRLGFSEPMDLSSFPDQVFLVSGSDTVRGEFTGGSESDTVRRGDTLLYVVEFSPYPRGESGGSPPPPVGPPLDLWRSYFLTLLGGVRDTAGNSLSIELDFSITYEFATGENIPRVLLADRTQGQVLAVDTLRVWTFTAALSQPTRFAFLEERSAVAITDEANASGYLKVFSMDGAIMDSIRTGGRQNGLYYWEGMFVVTTKSPRAYYLIDASTLQVVDSGHISVTPKRVAMNDTHIYILSTTRSILAIDRTTGDEVLISGALASPLRFPEMVVDGQGIVAVNDYSGQRILLISGLDTTHVPLPGLHPTDVTPCPWPTFGFMITTEEGTLIRINNDGAVEAEDALPGRATALTEFGRYVYFPDLSAGDHTGFLVLLGDRKEVLRGIPVGTTVSEIFSIPST